MRITTLWHEPAEGCMPWMLSAYDEYTEDENGGTPEDYEKIKKEYLGKCRELIVTIPDTVVVKLFETPGVEGKAKLA